MISSYDILHGKVLIVDDKEANVSLLEQMLRGAGYVSITSTMEPGEVCALHVENCYDLILLDLEMPVMDGFQVMEGLKEIETSGYLPVLVITAKPEHKVRALKAGAKDFVSKPFDLAEVLIRVYNMLEVRLLHLETKKLYDQIVAEKKALRRHDERLRNLHGIDQAILQSIESPEAIVQTAIQHLRGLLHCQRASVGIFDFETNEVMVFAADVNVETIVRTGKKLEENAFGEMEILQQGKMEFVEDMSKVKSHSAIIKIFQTEGILSYINVPLNSARGLYGALNIGWESLRTFIPEEIEIVGEVAAEVTIAIEQARLHKETKRYATELEHRVKGRTTQLETSNKELDAFAYSVSHDLRAPLRSIDGFSLILLEDYAQKLDEKGKDCLQRVRTATQRMAQLIDDLLSLSRISRSDLRRVNVNMSTIAHEIAEELRKTDPGRDVEFAITPELNASGDAQLLRIVLDNLIRNAFKFTSKHAKARIEFGMADRNGTHTYYVRDDGAGFDMKYADKLFGAFQRMHSLVEFPGTGIGLATVQRIINRHGGRVWGESEVEKGATFYFTLQ